MIKAKIIWENKNTGLKSEGEYILYESIDILREKIEIMNNKYSYIYPQDSIYISFPL